jgi:aldehyde dehydrogenase (NAD+)
MEDLIKQLNLKQINAGAGTGVTQRKCNGEELKSFSPIDGKLIGSIRKALVPDYEYVAEKAYKAFLEWRMTPAPKRGEIVRQIGNAVRNKKKELGRLISLEVGKIRSEAEGEIQEMIDICDFAVGQSRMLYGISMHSERPRHRMYEQ